MLTFIRWRTAPRTIRSSLADTRLTLFIAIILVIGIVLVFLHSVAAVMIPAIVGAGLHYRQFFRSISLWVSAR